MKIISVIPVNGRHSLVSFVVKRLVRQGVQVICVGGQGDQEVCENAGAEFYYHINEPLGKKWNYGFQMAKSHNPDAVLLMGSSSLISDNYLSHMTPFLEDHHLVGKQQFNILHLGERLEMVRWMHYPKEKYRLKHRLLPKGERAFIKAGGRYIEPVGIGRLLRADFLDAIDWKPYDDEAPSNLDYIMMCKLSDFHGSYMQVRDQHCQSLKITSDKWGNLNSFEKYKTIKTVKEFIAPIEFLMVWFPDVLKLEL